ncbi:MAG: SirB2 family protein [Idiomarina sp.]|nr:SirB2 family protein [Idiomarina sp.]
MYEMFKHSHATLAVLSLVFLLLRVFLAWKDSGPLNKKWLKIVPHVIDGLLVVSIIALLTTLQQTPLSGGFFTEKFVGFLVYITCSVLTVMTLRGRFSPRLKVPFLLGAIVSWFWLANVAFSKQPLLFAMI